MVGRAARAPRVPALVIVPNEPTELLSLEAGSNAAEHLYPLLAPGGVLIIDDYGHWEGARRAVEEYFKGMAAPCCSAGSTTPAGSPSSTDLAREEVEVIVKLGQLSDGLILYHGFALRQDVAMPLK